jgi:hypothetical protein
MGLVGPTGGLNAVTKRPLFKKSKREASFHSGFLLGLFFDPEDGGNILRNVC